MDARLRGLRTLCIHLRARRIKPAKLSVLVHVEIETSTVPPVPSVPSVQIPMTTCNAVPDESSKNAKRNGARGAIGLVDLDEQLCLQDELALLVLLSRLICLIVFPTNGVLTLSAEDVSDNVPAGGHAALVRVPQDNVDDVFEEEGLAMLTAEILPSVL